MTLVPLGPDVPHDSGSRAARVSGSSMGTWAGVQGRGGIGGGHVVWLRSRDKAVPSLLGKVGGCLQVAVYPSHVGTVLGALQVGLAVIAAERGGLLLHAAAVVGSSGVLVVPGVSGAGKTTILDAFGSARAMADERVMVMRQASRWSVASVPVAGPQYAWIRSRRAKLTMIGFVAKNRESAVRRLSTAEAISRLVPAVKVPAGSGIGLGRILAILQRLLADVTVVEIAYRRGDSVPSLLDQAGLSW